MATKTNELGSLELPATEPYRVVGVGATYLDAQETIGPDGKPAVVYTSKVGMRGETIELNEHQARRLVSLDAVKPVDEPLSYDEMNVEDLEKLAKARGIKVPSSGADEERPLKTDYVNALNTYDQGVGVDSTDAGVTVASSSPGGVSVADAKAQTGRRPA